MSNTEPLVTGLFRDRDSAEQAYQSVQDRGYGKDDVNLVMSDDTRQRYFADDVRVTELGTKAAEGAGVGGAIGGTVGAIAAAIAAVGTTLAIPGLGLVIAGAGAGAATGGLVGALIGWGIPEERLKTYDAGIRDGAILMAVKPRSDEDAAHFENQWRVARGQDVYR